MAGIQIGQLPAGSSAGFGDLVAAVQGYSGPNTGDTVKLTLTQLLALMDQGVSVGASVKAAGAFTTLQATGAVSGAGFVARFASPGPIGSTTPSSGDFTTLSAASTVSGAGFVAYLASPPAIGGTVANTGKFSTLNVTGTSTLASNSVNYATLAGGAASNPLLFTPTGADTNVDLRFNPKGQGVVHTDRFSVGTFAASSTYGAARRFTAFVANTLSGSTPGATYRFGGSVTGTIDASLTGYFPIVLDNDTLKFSNTSHGMVFNYVAQSMSAGWSGGRATHQSYLFINGDGSAGDISGGANAYHVSGSSFIQVGGKMGGNSGDTRGNAFARNDGVTILSGAGYHINSAVGHEIDMGVRSGAEVLYKVGHKVGLWSQDAVRGAIADYAYSHFLTANITGSSGWRIGWALGAYEAWWPYTGSSTLVGLVRTAASIAAGAPSYTLGVGFDLRGITVNEAAYATTGFLVDGSGNAGALIASGVSLQTRSAVLAKTAVVNTITVVEGGLYVGAVTLTGTAPTTSGTTATASVATYSLPYAYTIDARGTGYAVGDTITISGGTFSSQCTGIVTEVSGGAVYGVKFTTPGSYSVLPAFPAATTTSGSGTGCTITPALSVLTVTVTNPGTNYSEWLPPNFTSAGAVGTYRQAKFKVSMTATQGQMLMNLGNDAVVENLVFRNPTGTDVVTASFPNFSGSPRNELMFINNQAGLNVLGVQNNNASGYSAFIGRGADNVEHFALGYGNSGSGPANTAYYEVSHYTGASHAINPPNFEFLQTGYVAGSYGQRKVWVLDGAASGDGNWYMTWRDTSGNIKVRYNRNNGYFALQQSTYPAAPLDVLGTAVFGNSNNSRSTVGVAAPIAVNDTGAAMAKFVRVSVAGAIWQINGSGSTASLDLVDDSSSTPLSINIGTGGTKTTQVTSLALGSGGPTFTAGTGAPGAMQPKGSLYSRTDGGVGTTLYVSQGGGTWNAVAGV